MVHLKLYPEDNESISNTYECIFLTFFPKSDKMAAKNFIWFSENIANDWNIYSKNYILVEMFETNE